MKKRSMKMLLIALLAVIVVLAGCNSGNKTGGSKDTGKGENTPKKDTLVYGRGGDSTSLDPITTTEGEAFRVTENIFETLVQYGDKDTTINPGLAEKWEVSDD